MLSDALWGIDFFFFFFCITLEYTLLLGNPESKNVLQFVSVTSDLHTTNETMCGKRMYEGAREESYLMCYVTSVRLHAQCVYNFYKTPTLLIETTTWG